MTVLAPAAPLLAFITVAKLLSILYVVLGLGLVIFFHELGHFAVAKWCDVRVERFSLGFGPILWRFKKGETEYALSAIPFGGYVKMLGQDDMDPSQLTQEEISEDPRSYSAKNVPQRMAIISAGVIMNVITGLLFFAIAFGAGVRQNPGIVGGTQVGFPAWEAGIRNGDQITRIGSFDVRSFRDVMRAVSLSSSDSLEVEGIRADGKTRFKVTLEPYRPGSGKKVTRRIIGVGPMASLEIAHMDVANFNPWEAGSAASRAEPPIPAGGTVVNVNGTEVTSFTEMMAIAVRRRNEDLVLTILPKDAEEGAEPTTHRVPPTPFRTIGLKFEMGTVASIRKGSPAERAGLQPGDKITHVDEVAVGNVIDPFHLPDVFHEAAEKGAPVVVKFTREQKGRERKEMEVDVSPDEIAGWTELPTGPDIPLPIPAIGLAFHVLPDVAAVDAESPAAGKIDAGARVLSWELVRDETLEEKDAFQDVKIPLGKEDRNVAYAFWQTQHLAQRSVKLTVETPAGEQETVELDPRPADDWFMPGDRGITFFTLATEVEADDFGDAFGMACRHTRDSILDIYLTLRNLFTRDLSVTELNGPIGIGEVAYKIAQQGLAPLLMFLGFLSMNLAVLNFLPIPLLDGGHMVFLIWEGVTRRKPSEGVLIAATYVGMVFVLGLLGFVLYLDIFVH